MSKETKELTTYSDKSLSRDTSSHQNLLDTKKFEHLWRVAKLFSSSELVPDQYKSKPQNAMIALQMAFRLNVDPMMLMQNTYIIKGRPGMEGKLAIALVNSSGLFDKPLRFELEGRIERDDKGIIRGGTMRCRAWTTQGGERINGPWVTIEMVVNEGWHLPKGTQKSKWDTMPELMFQYRAGTFFARMNCPERLMGMQTIEEIQDVEFVEHNKRKKTLDELLDESEEAQISTESDDLPETQTEPETDRTEPVRQQNEDVEEQPESESEPEKSKVQEDTEAEILRGVKTQIMKAGKNMPIQRFNEIMGNHGASQLSEVTTVDQANAILEEMNG